MLATLGEKVNFVFGFCSPPRPNTQSILPLLNIYYLERIEETALKKGECFSLSLSQ